MRSKEDDLQPRRTWLPTMSETVDTETLRAWRRWPRRSTNASVTTTVMAVHGLEGTWDSWVDLADALGPGYDVHALDLPWRAGNSYEWPAIAAAATWLRWAVESTSVVADVVIAHSFGASAILQLLGLGLLDVRAAVLIAPLYRPDDDVEHPGYPAQATDRFRAVVRQGLVARLGERVERMSTELLDVMTRKLTDHAETGGVLASVGMVRELRTAWLDSVDVPVMIVSGQLDQSAPWPAVRTLAARLGAELVRPHDFGHFCQIDRPGQVARIVRDFFSDTRISPAATATFEQVG